MSEHRYYGAEGTIHRTGHLDVEVDHWGDVVAVWFRCQPLPFKQTEVDTHRAAEMNGMYAQGSNADRIRGIEFEDE